MEVMDELDIERYRRYINHEVEYNISQTMWNQLKGINRKKYSGTLTDVVYRKGKYFAIIKRLGRSFDSRVRPKTYNKIIIDTVLLSRVDLREQRISPNEAHCDPSAVQEHAGNPSSNIREPDFIGWNFSSKILHYNHLRYEQTETNELKIGDQVTWRDQMPSPMIGTINWTGKRYLDGISIEYVAVVQFEQSTEQYPGYIKGPPHNCNIINVNDLANSASQTKGFCQDNSNVFLPLTDPNGDCFPQENTSDLVPRDVSAINAISICEPFGLTPSKDTSHNSEYKEVNDIATFQDTSAGDNVASGHKREMLWPMSQAVTITRSSSTVGGSKEVFPVPQSDDSKSHFPNAPNRDNDIHNILNMTDIDCKQNMFPHTEETNSDHFAVENENDITPRQFWKQVSSPISTTVPFQGYKIDVIPNGDGDDKMHISVDISTSDMTTPSRDALEPMRVDDAVNWNTESRSLSNYCKVELGNSLKSPNEQNTVTPAEMLYLAAGNPFNPDQKYGIQGLNNSCYMDASIYSLFAYNKWLDEHISSNCKSDEGGNTAVDQVATRLRSIMKELRKHHFVSNKRMKKLRNELVMIKGSQYEHDYIDADAFLTDLFRLLNIPGLFAYDQGEEGYIHDILLPENWDESQYQNYMTLQFLLEQSFTSSEVKLADVPKSVFIIKLPVQEGRFIPCNGVIPTVVLDLSNVIEGGEHATMLLSAVICQRGSRFVTFVCLDSKDDASRWVFMDSRPTTQEPEVHFLEGMSREIVKAQEELETKPLSQHEPSCCGYRLFRDAYVCIYVHA